MKTTQKETMYQQIEKHGNNLNTIFNTGLDNITLCKKLHPLEGKAHRLITIECNTGEDMDEQLSKILVSVKKILFPKGLLNSDTDLYYSVFINGDPRGYTFKIQDKYVRDNKLSIETDWGGYGIIAPDFTPNN